MNRVISVAFLPVMVISVGVVLLAVIGAGPSGTPTASASHAPVNLVAIDFTTLGNSATTVGTIDPCAAVPSATQTDLTFDLVATGIPAETLESDRMNIFEVHIAYDDPATGASPDGFTPVPDQSGAAALAVQSADRNFYISSGGRVVR